MSKPIEAWLQKQQTLVSDDWDNVTLYTGEEGTGKSNTMLQIMKRLDPCFSLERIHFDEQSFLDHARGLPRGAAIMLDEFDGHRRAAMHGHRLEFLRFLKEVRGLNLHMGIGFPHVTQLDRDILRSRIRNIVHHARRGVITIRERHSVVRFAQNGADPEVVVSWPEFGSYRVGQNKGAFYKSYKDAKEAYMRRTRDLEADPEPEPLFAPPAALLQAFLARRLVAAPVAPLVQEPAPKPKVFSSGDAKWADLVQAELKAGA